MKERGTAVVDDSAGFSVNFSFEKETPATYRFQESGAKETHKIGTLYVRKSALPFAPGGLKIRVEVVK